MTDDPNDRAAYVRDLIATRCPEITAADLDALAAPLPLDQILEVLDLMAERLSAIESRYAADVDEAPVKRRAG
jgi:hypothetical protein